MLRIKIIYVVLTVIFSLGVGSICGYIIRKYIAEAKIATAEEKAKKIIQEAYKDAEASKRELLLEAKEEVHKLRNEFEKESRERRNEFQKTEKRLAIKEENLERKASNLEKKEEYINKKLKEIQKTKQDVEKLYQQQVEELERLSGLTSEQAKELLLNDIKKDIKYDAAKMIKEVETQAKEEAEKRAKSIISCAIQKYAAEHVAETTVSVVSLPNDEMKGRIIGREGRNIRTLEAATGIDLIIDDTPEAVILSGFDPIRREIARIALEKLIIDGRIHPARIEEMVEKAEKEMDIKIREQGEQATFETGIHGIHPELVKLLGRLKYRTSYGQNVLRHCLEVSHFAGIMAAELNADIKLAKRAGLLHDIGKAVDHEREGSHVKIGAELAKRYKENDDVIHAILAHHGDIEPNSVEAALVQAADTLSAARPGARRETLEAYISRLEKLEKIANSFAGVEKSYAIQAGREIRILVKPESVKDDEIFEVAREIVKNIENEVEYPGQIKVNVIRETRAIEYAK